MEPSKASWGCKHLAASKNRSEAIRVKQKVEFHLLTTGWGSDYLNSTPSSAAAIEGRLGAFLAMGSGTVRLGFI